MDIKEQELLGGAVDHHWYYRSKLLALDSMLREAPARHVLDVGAGSAIFSRHLLQCGAESALCVDPAYGLEHDERFEGKPIRFVREVCPWNADLVLLMDVLEHVDNDLALIRSSLAGADPGAYVLISVPAFPSLFSAHDRFLEHRRRYTIRSLESLVSAAGLEILSTRYFFAFILPLVAAIRFFERDSTPKSSLKEHSPAVNEVLTVAHRIELPLFRFNRLGGLSIFCLARVP